jgi:hypothetical protein
MKYLCKKKLEQTFNLINIIFLILSLLNYQNSGCIYFMLFSGKTEQRISEV